MIGLKGKRVTLRPPRIEDLDIVYVLWNSKEVYTNTDNAYWIPNSKEKFKEFFEIFHLKGETLSQENKTLCLLLK